MMNNKHLKTSNGDAEVFVLPPNILEKLGINLCNITENTASSEKPKKKRKSKYSISNVSYSNHEGVIKDLPKSHNAETSSILETANLMKKSVFLSPTFVPMVVDTIPGEVEIAKNFNSEEFVEQLPQVNGEIIAKYSNSNKQLNPDTCTFESKKEPLNFKKNYITETCNVNGSDIGHRNKIEENFFSNGILNNNLNQDGFMHKSKVDSEKNYELLESVISLPASNNNVQASSRSKVKLGMVQNKTTCDSDINSNNVNNQVASPVSTRILKDNLVSLNSNTDSYTIDKSVAHIDTLTSNHDEALIIPVSVISDITKNVNESYITYNAEDINMFDMCQSLSTQDLSNSSEINGRKEEQKFVIPIATDCKSTEVLHNPENIIIDIINYTECEENHDMEIENMLLETEISIPISASTIENKESYNKTNDAVSKETNESKGNQMIGENEPCNEIESKILISLLPNLTDSPNFNQYIGDTQSINLDIFYEHSNEIDISNSNGNPKIVIPISSGCESMQDIVVNEIDQKSSNECNESSDMSDMELDNILRDTQILIHSHLNTRSLESIDNKSNDDMKFCSTKEQKILEKVENVWSEYKNPLSVSFESTHSREIEKTDGVSINGLVDCDDNNSQINDFIEDRALSPIKEVNNQIIKESDCCGKILPREKAFPSNTNHSKSLNHVSSTENTEYNIKCTRNTIINPEYTNQKHENSNIAGTGEHKNCILKTDVSTVQFIKMKTDKTVPMEMSQYLPKGIQFEDQCDITRGTNVQTDVNILKEDLQSKISGTIIEQKVQEIAVCLKHVLNKSNKKKGNKECVKILKPKPVNLTKSKIFKQGVEKPGGSEKQKIDFEKLKNLKTYEVRRKKRDIPIVSELNKSTSEENTDNYTDINICIDPIFSPKRQEFCLCGDFGKLTYADYDNFYEHIHFACNKMVHCSVDTIYEIYNETSIERNTEEITEDKPYIQGEDESPDCDDCYICWQKFEYNDKYSHANMQSDLKLPDSTEDENSRVREKDFNIEEDKDVKEISDDIAATSMKSNDLITEIIVEVNCEISQFSNSNTLACQKEIEHNKLELHNTPVKVGTVSNATRDNETGDISVISEAKINEPKHCNIDNEGEKEEINKKLNDRLKSRKRQIEHSKNYKEPSAKKDVKCGVCEQILCESEWEDHIYKVHCYIAWKNGHTLDLDNLLLLKKLKKKLEADGRLVCNCAFENNNLEIFLSHVKKCVTNDVPKYNSDYSNSSKEVASTSKSGKIKCGVCGLTVDDLDWVEHLSKEHQYLGWKDGEPPLDLNDVDEVKRHLLNLVKKYGHLICTKCGMLRKYTPKSINCYLTHLKQCSSNEAERSRTPSRNSNKSRRSVVESEPLSVVPSHPSPKPYKCAVCEQNVEQSEWYTHIQQEHDYRAWKDGEEAPNFDDEDVLWRYLHDISKQIGGLQCSKCDMTRKYVKSYLHHLKSCTASKSDDGNHISDVQEVETQRASPDVNTSNTLDSNRKTKEKKGLAFETPRASKESDVVNSTDTDTPQSSKKNLESSNNTTCGVCNAFVSEVDWFDHIGKEHNYIAWRKGETPLNSEDTEALWQHLHNIVCTAGKLVCAKCGKARKYPKLYLQHISQCQGSGTYNLDDSLNYGVISHVDRSLKGQNMDMNVKQVKCGVCQEMVSRDAWIAHIQTAHNYIAWIDGETPLDLNNHDLVREHLQQIVDEVGSLICTKCGITRKYAKKFFDHMAQCSYKTSSGKGCSGFQNLPANEIVSCSVCQQKVQMNQWINHIRMSHNYLAWKIIPGSKTQGLAQKRLQSLITKLGALLCPTCGHGCNDSDSYLEHTNTCKGNPDYVEPEDVEAKNLMQKGLYQCAMCRQHVKYGEWQKHSIDKHYIMAWAVGDEPIDLFSQHEVTKAMNEYLQHGSFVCRVCGITRSSGIGFFAHIISCGLTEEESDRFKMTCEICDAKYPGIYKSQHMNAHTQQELSKERKERAEEVREREKQRKLDELTAVSGRRRAAEKARMVIEETVSQFKHVCQLCTFATDAEEEMATHKCPKKRKMSDELDMSLEQDESSDGEALEDEAESEEEEEEEEKEEEEEGVDCRSDRRKRPDSSHSSAKTRIPFAIMNVPVYIGKYAKEHSNSYLTTETLFPEWLKCDYEAMAGDELQAYIPPMEESCQVYANDKWCSYTRWQASVEKQKITLFTGACIRQLLWLPSHLSVKEHEERNVLAVACHGGSDCPQFEVDQLPEHRAVIQFWDFGNFRTTPKMVFGLALHYGTVWSMDWCPSGAREIFPKESGEGFVRMGLLAVACSNGFAYIFSVPYPASITSTSDNKIYKLKPVAQLKFTTKSDRKRFQATSVCWTTQKGHATVIVGYSDGSTAFYDLNTESPFLKSQENDVTIFYPFYDEHTHNGCVTDMSSFPVARSTSAAGAVAVSSPTGSVVNSAGAIRSCARARSHLASSTVMFLPAWPSALLAGEDFVTNLTPGELEYFGQGRRAGFVHTCCGCLHCADVATYMAPFLRVMHPHHARADLKKQVVAWISAKQLGKKRKHNEEKSMGKDEPRTYEDAVKKYGIEFKMINKVKNKAEYKKASTQYKEINPERFPLTDVPSIAFCPTAKYHKRLAVATHAGLIFVLNA